MPARSLHVLVVEGNPVVRRLIVEYLAVDGHTAEVAQDGPEGWEQFRTGTFDLVLLDRALPMLSGDELAIAIKRVAPATPVIMLTGYGGLMHAVGERPADVDLVLGKPWTLAEFRRAVTRVTDGR